MTLGTRVLHCAALLAFAATALLGQDKPNFSGEWKMNAAKSDFGPMPAPDKYIRKIDHQEPNWKFALTQAGQQGEFTTEGTCTTDGKECSYKTQFGEIKYTMKWDGKQMVVNAKFNIQGNDITSVDKYSLADDGKTVTINGSFQSPQGAFDRKIVLEKQ